MARTHKRLDQRVARLAGAEAGRQDDERLLALFDRESNMERETKREYHYGAPIDEEIEYEEAIGGLQATNKTLLEALEAMLGAFPPSKFIDDPEFAAESKDKPKFQAHLLARAAIEQAKC